MGLIRGVTTALVLAVLASAASLALHAQDSGQPAPAPQAQPATPPAPPQPKSVTTNLGRDFTTWKPMFSFSKGWIPNPLGPYKPTPIPMPQFSNSPRIQQLIRDGKLMLSLQDAIELALQNNTDILIQRMYPSIADTDVTRARAGANVRGVGNVNPPSIFANSPNTLSYDPSLVSSVAFDSRHSPVNNPLTAGTGTSSNALSSQFTHNTTSSVQYLQNFVTGTSVTASLANVRASTTSGAVFFSPSVQSVASLTVSQQLLNGFGRGVNQRILRIARIARKGSDLAFTQSVITDIVNVQSAYWELVFATGNVEVNRHAVELAQRLYDDNQRQVEIGTLAPLELVRAEAQLATAQQSLIAAQTTQLQQQIALMNLITKNVADPALANIQIVPLDSADVPPPPIENMPLSSAVSEALTNRPDVQLSKLNLTGHDINIEIVRNGMLPTLTVNGFVSGTGLAGDSNPLSSRKPVIESGFPTALNTALGGSFPEYTATINLTVPLRNRAAQADMARALLLQQQDQTRLLQLQNTVAVDVQNTQVLLKQSRTAVDAAVKNRILNEQALNAEQTKFQLGASTIFLVVQAQQALSAAAAAEVRARVNLAEARNNFERAMGRTLAVNRVNISDAALPSNNPADFAQIPGTTATGQLVGLNATTPSNRR
jgi:outer membrane protein